MPINTVCEEIIIVINITYYSIICTLYIVLNIHLIHEMYLKIMPKVHYTFRYTECLRTN